MKKIFYIFFLGLVSVFLLLSAHFSLANNTNNSAAVFRTIADGNWNSTNIWEFKISDGIYQPAERVPALADDTIYINHHVIIDESIAIDQIVVNEVGHLFITAKKNTNYVFEVYLSKTLPQPGILVLGELTISAAEVSGASIEVKGDITIEDYSFVYTTVVFSGTRSQELKGYNGNSMEPGESPIIDGLIIANPHGVTIQNEQTVGNIVFRQGILYGGFSLNLFGSCYGVSDSTFVDKGINIMVWPWNWDATLYFPIGAYGKFLPVSIKLKGSDYDPAHTMWQGIYVGIVDGPPPHQVLPTNISHVSSIRYYETRLLNQSWALEYYIKLSYNEDDGITDPSNMTILKFNGARYRDLLGAASGVPKETISATRDFKNVDYYCVLANKVGGNNLLPVTWLSFEANAVNADAHLNWRTAQEQRCADYEVELSSNGVQFTKIGNQPCRNTTTQQTYSFVDVNPGKGTFYYRLKQVDTDGKFEYSPVRKVSFGTDGRMLVYPNPARDRILISEIPGNSDIRLYDASGRMVLQSRNAQPFGQLQVGHLPAGIYQLSITTITGERIVEKVQIMK